MCTGVEYALLAASLAGTATSIYSQQEAAKERADILGANAEESLAKTDQMADLTKEHVSDTYGAQGRAKNYQQAVDSSNSSLADVLSDAASLGKDKVSASTTGALSEDYTAGRSAASDAAASKAKKTASLMAKANGLSNLFNTESDKNADYSSDMLGITSSIRRGANAARNAVNNVRDNSGIGQFVSNAALAYAGNK